MPTDPNSFATSALQWTSTTGMSPLTYNSWHGQIVSALNVGILDPGGDYQKQTGKCAGATTPPSNTLQLASTSLGLASTGATVGLTIAGITGSAIPIIGAGIAAGELLVTIVGKLFGPATSLLEGKYLCPLVASANQVLVQIMSELAQGQIQLQQAIIAIDSLYTSFHNQLLQPQQLGGQTNALLYYNTPNDSQFFDSALGAMRDYNSQVRYPQIAAQGTAAIAGAQAAATAQQQATINAAVQAALAQAGITPGLTASPTGLQAQQTVAAQQAGAPSISPMVLALIAAAGVVVFLLVI